MMMMMMINVKCTDVDPVTVSPFCRFSLRIMLFIGDAESSQSGLSVTIIAGVVVAAVVVTAIIVVVDVVVFECRRRRLVWLVKTF